MLEKYLNKKLIEAGCDEAGRGCLAGPVAAAAVIMPKDFFHPLLNDSKKLSVKQREILRPIIEDYAIKWAVAFIDNEEIDQLNILKASLKCMHLALDDLTIKPDHILVDGNRFFPYHGIAHSCIVKGDGKYVSIAAASILAKTHRDEKMADIHQEYPGYGWKKNKGYPTRLHREAIKKIGVSPFHRKSFKLLPLPTLF
jgi:ribonuclease HII